MWQEDRGVTNRDSETGKGDGERRPGRRGEMGTVKEGGGGCDEEEASKKRTVVFQ